MSETQNSTGSQTDSSVMKLLDEILKNMVKKEDLKNMVKKEDLLHLKEDQKKKREEVSQCATSLSVSICSCKEIFTKTKTYRNYSRIQCGMIFVVAFLPNELKKLIKEIEPKAKLIVISSSHGFFDEPEELEDGEIFYSTNFPMNLNGLRVIDQNHNIFEISKVLVSKLYLEKEYASEDISFSILKEQENMNEIVSHYSSKCQLLAIPNLNQNHVLQIHDNLEGCSYLYQSKNNSELYGAKGNVERIDDYSNIYLKTFSAHGDSGTCFFKDNTFVGVLHGGDESFTGIREKEYKSLEHQFKENMNNVSNYIVKIASSQSKFNIG